MNCVAAGNFHNGKVARKTSKLPPVERKQKSQRPNASLPNAFLSFEGGFAEVVIKNSLNNVGLLLSTFAPQWAVVEQEILQ